MSAHIHQPQRDRNLRTWRVAPLAFAAMLAWSPTKAETQPTFTEFKGTTPVRETTFAMRVPTNWNGTVISDLDFASATGARATLFMYLLDKGYATVGMARRADRALHYDSSREITDAITVLDIFETKFGKPKRVIQMGISGGGHLALLMAENQPNRIDGAIAECAHGPIWQANSDMDLWFSLRALLGRNDLVVANLPLDTKQVVADWKLALQNAQATPEGRARIALAYTIAQYPTWVDPSGAVTPARPEPNVHDSVALEKDMYEGILGSLAMQFAPLRLMYEQATPGGLSWNTDVDYRAFYKNADPLQKSAVDALYKAAGLKVAKDISTINESPRVKADPKALKFWSSPGRMYVGKPKVPVMRIHTSGDPLALSTLVQGYDAAVKRNGFEALYRTAFVHNAGHCSFSVAEAAAAVETIQRRLDTGVWGRTDPEAMNALAVSLVPNDPARFFQFNQLVYNRAWFASVPDYLSGGSGERDR